MILLAPRRFEDPERIGDADQTARALRRSRPNTRPGLAGGPRPDVPICAALTSAGFVALARRSGRGDMREVADSGAADE